MHQLDENDKIEKLQKRIQQLENQVNTSSLNDFLSLPGCIWSGSEEKMILSDQKGLILDVNPAFCNFTGMQKNDWVGKDLFQWLDEDFVKGITKDYSKFVHSGKLFPHSFEWKNGQGKTFKSKISGNIIEHLGQEMFLWFIKDEKILADHQLVQKADWLTRLSQTLPGAIYQYRLFPDGRSEFPFISQNVYQLYVIDESLEITSDKIFQAVHPDDLPGLRQAIIDSATTLQQFHHQCRMKTGHGEYIWFDLRSNPEKQPDGSITWNGVLLDIQELKDSQQKMQESEANLQAIFNNTLQLFLVLDPEYKIVAINRIAQSYYHKFLNRHITIGESILPLIYPPHLEDFKKNFQRALNGEHIQVERDLPFENDRAFFLFNYNPVITPGKPTDKVVFSVIDITVGKKASLSLLEKEKQLELITRTVEDVLFMTDEYLNLSYLSPSVESLFGYRPEEIQKNGFLGLVQEDSAHLVHQLHQERNLIIQRVAENNDRHLLEVNCLNRNGSRLVIRISTTPVFNEHGEFTGTVGIAHDVTEEKRKQTALKQSEEKYRFLTEATSELICLHENDGTFSYVSPSAKNLLGYEVSELIGRNPYDFCHPDDIDRIRTHSHELALKGKSVNGIDYRFKTKNKGYIWLDTFTDTLSGPDNEVISLITRSRNITDRKFAENQLRKSEKQLKLLFENMNRAFALHKIVTDSTGKPVNYIYLEVNNKFEELTGLKREDILNKKVLDVIPNLETYWIEQFGKVALEGTPLEYNNYVNEFDRYFETKAYCPQTGYFAVTFTDITEMVKAQRALKDSERRFSLLSNLTLEGIVIHKNGVLVDINLAFTRLTGYERDELLNQHVVELLAKPEYRKSINENIRNKFSQPYEAVILHKDGTEIPVELQANNFDYQGEELRVVAVRDISERLKARKALEESEEKFRMVATSANDIIIEWTVASDIIRWYGDATFVFGTSKIPQTSEELIEYIHPNDRNKFRKYTWESLVQNNTWSFQYRLVIDKKIKYIAGSGKAVYDEAGYPLKMYGAITDISERTKLIQDLKKSKKDLEIRNDISNIFIRIKSDKVFDQVMKRIQKEIKSEYGFFGFIDEYGNLVCPSINMEVWSNDIRNKKNEPVIFPPENWSGLWGDVLEEKKSMIKNEGLILPAGHLQLKNAMAAPIIYRNLAIGLILLADHPKGYKEKHLQVLTNICSYISPLLYARLQNQKYEHQLILAKEKAENAAQLFRTVFEQAEVGIVIIRPDGMISQPNQKFCDILGYAQEELKGEGFFHLTHPEDQAKDLEMMERILKEQLNFFQIQKRYIHKDGSIVYVNGYASIVRDEDGQSKYAVGVINDITRQKLAEDSLLKSESALKKQNEEVKAANLALLDRNREIIKINEQLKKANSELDSFVYRVSHDLRAPITSSLGLAKLSQHTTDLTEIRHYNELQTESLIKLDRFIHDILNYSRNSRMEVTPEPVKFAEMVADILKENKYKIEETNIRIEQKIQNQPEFCSDLLRVQIILQNLISNAIKFQNPYNEDPMIRIEIQAEPAKAEILIEDNGIGIDPVHHQRVFEMFYRATDKRPGSGIGLYIVKDCLQKIKGEMDMNSGIGKGTSFRLKLPNLIKQK